MKPIERVKKIIDYLEITISGFEKSTGLSNNSIQTAIKRNSNLKDETLNTILKRYPQFDAGWLLTGNGNMLKDESEMVKEKTIDEMIDGRMDNKVSDIVDTFHNEISEVRKELMLLAKAFAEDRLSDVKKSMKEKASLKQSKD